MFLTFVSVTIILVSIWEENKKSYVGSSVFSLFFIFLLLIIL